MFVANISLSILLIIAILFLLFTVLPSRLVENRFCATHSGNCFWPFGRHSRRTVLLISMDGFRHDYLELIRARLGPDSLPNFAKFEANGARPRRSVNVYPTVTLPNHQTLITGLYTPDHGIVANVVHDRAKPNDTFAMGDQFSLNEAPWLTGWPEPIWITVQRTGRLVGSLLWPLTDGLVAGDRPFQQVSQFTQLNSFNTRYMYQKRVDDLLWWLDNPRYHLDLILAYFDEPDESGHAYGPYSDQVAQAVTQLDIALGQLMDGIKERGLTEQVDIILTADHGMTNTSSEQVIALDPLVSPEDYKAIMLSTAGLLFANKTNTDKLYEKLHGAHPNLSVYRQSEVLEYLHFNRNNSRMPDLVLVPDPGWYLVRSQGTPIVLGDHGYSPNFTDMSPFLIASGPSFKRVGLVDSVEVHSVDIYPLMCRLLHVHPQPNNGSLKRILPLVRPEVAEELLHFEEWPEWLALFVVQLHLVWFLLNIAIIFTLMALLFLSFRMQRKWAEGSIYSTPPVLHVENLPPNQNAARC